MWAMASGRRVRVDAARLAAAAARLDPSPGRSSEPAESPGAWAMASGRRVHVDAAAVAAAAARLGQGPGAGAPPADAELGKRAPLAEPGAIRVPLAELGAPVSPCGGLPNPGATLRSAAARAGAPGEMQGGRERGRADSQHAACAALHPITASRPAPSPAAAQPPEGADSPVTLGGACGRVAGGGGGADASGTPAAAPGPGSEPGTAGGRAGRRAAGGLSRSRSGSVFKAPRRFQSPLRHPGIAKARRGPRPPRPPRRRAGGLRLVRTRAWACAAQQVKRGRGTTGCWRAV